MFHSFLRHFERKYSLSFRLLDGEKSIKKVFEMALQSLVVLWDEILHSGNSFVIWRRCRGASRGGLELKWGFYVLIRFWLISRQHLWACIFILNLCHWYESIAWRRLISYNLDIVMLHISVIWMMIELGNNQLSITWTGAWPRGTGAT